MSEWEWEESKTSILNGLFKNLGFKENVVNREEGGSKRVIRI